jgi:hypothetical protein
MKSILLSGDSGGLGEYQYSKDDGYFKCVGFGIEYYLQKAGYLIKNISIESAANMDTTINLVTQHKNFDILIWIQADPIRDLRPYITFQKDFNSFDQLITKQKELLNNSYATLNSINRPILCIGGCSKLDLDLMKQFNNLIPVIPSIYELFEPSYTHPVIWMSEWHVLIGRQFDIDSIGKFSYNKDNQNALRELDSDYMSLDGTHANRTGYKKITDHLLNYENLS